MKKFFKFALFSSGLIYIFNKHPNALNTNKNFNPYPPTNPNPSNDIHIPKPSSMQVLSFGVGSKHIIFIECNDNLFSLGNKENFHSLLQRDYTIHIISIKVDLCYEHQLLDISKNIVQYIDRDFCGHVDGIFGASMGGFLLQEIALHRPDIANRFGIIASAYKFNDSLYNSEKNFQYKELINQLTNKILNNPLFNQLVSFIFSGQNPATPTAYPIPCSQNKPEFNFRQQLPSIAVPMLIIGTDKDFWFSKQLYEETARLLPNSRLIILKNKGVSNIINREVIQIIEQFLENEF
ncbi:MAG: hypothetical protein ATN36_08060 [Epulopiscium sp. Nele67-Bin005]|nr:MAG: hypothetical protein ATN36_08060 [Epulopiscium sp. Nele67-Bin005]